MRTFRNLVVMAIVTATTLQSYASQGEKPMRQDDPNLFISNAAVGGAAEVELSRLASRKAETSVVKTFAKMMIKDHGKVNAELKKLAKAKNIMLPDLNISSPPLKKSADTGTSSADSSASPGRVASVTQAANAADLDVNQKLNKLIAHVPGMQFDTAYVKMMIKDHQDAIALFETGGRSSDAEVRAFAVKHLPELKMHLQQAMEIHNKMVNQKTKTKVMQH